MHLEVPFNKSWKFLTVGFINENIHSFKRIPPLSLKCWICKWWHTSLISWTNSGVYGLIWPVWWLILANVSKLSCVADWFKQFSNILTLFYLCYSQYVYSVFIFEYILPLGQGIQRIACYLSEDWVGLGLVYVLHFFFLFWPSLELQVFILKHHLLARRKVMTFPLS